jgi:hypothetical protein
MHCLECGGSICLGHALSSQAKLRKRSSPFTVSLLPLQDGIPKESGDFGDFRVRVSELIKDVVFLVGSSSCFAQMFENLKSQASAATWDQSEAALFVMCAVAKNILL